MVGLGMALVITVVLFGIIALLDRGSCTRQCATRMADPNRDPLLGCECRL